VKGLPPPRLSHRVFEWAATPRARRVHGASQRPHVHALVEVALWRRVPQLGCTEGRSALRRCRLL